MIKVVIGTKFEKQEIDVFQYVCTSRVNGPCRKDWLQMELVRFTSPMNVIFTVNQS